MAIGRLVARNRVRWSRRPSPQCPSRLASHVWIKRQTGRGYRREIGPNESQFFIGPGGETDECVIEGALLAILSGHVKTGQRWSWQNRPTEMARDKVVLLCRVLRGQVDFCAPAARTALKHVTVMQLSIGHGSYGRAVPV